MHEHPVATAEQHEHEKAALRLWEHPVVAEAREAVRAEWLEKEQPSPVDARLLRLGLRGGHVLGRDLVVEPGSAAPEGHLHHPARARGRRAAHPGHPVGHRQPRLDLPGDPDLGRRALRDPGPGRRAPDDRELLHAVGRQHGHRGPAQRARPRDRGRRLVRRHRRRRPGRRSPQPRAVDPEGPRVLHPRRHARLGRPTTPTGSRSSASVRRRRRAAHRRRAGAAHRRVHEEVRRLQPRPVEGDDERAAQPVPPRLLGRHRAARCATRCTSAATSSSRTTRRSSST